MTAKCVMVLGTTSGAGKSWLATALCRWYARQGLRVAPFKAQNMSNNARVVPGIDGQLGGEIGSAQYFQALAARVTPTVDMNPLLLKPEADSRSQVVLLGQVDRALGAMAWKDRSAAAWPAVQASLTALRQAYDVVVIEGAGSPAEINLMDSDIVNLRVAEAADAACLLVTDIDRGGAFAHLYGTHALIGPAAQARLRGFVLNRFRGDVALLEPAPQQLEAMTGVPTVAVLPMWREHGLPEEDGWYHRTSGHEYRATDHPTGCKVAVVAYPRVSNLDEFEPLRHADGVSLRWVRDAAGLADADLVVLPGSKNTRGDLQWLRECGLDKAIMQHAAQGKRVLGICGGLQMLGADLADPAGLDGGQGGSSRGLSLLSVSTQFELSKQVRLTQVCLADARGAWAGLNDVALSGYEIRLGQTVRLGDAQTLELSPGLMFQRGPVLGCYLHGLFENPQALLAITGSKSSGWDAMFDGLADFIGRHFKLGVLASLV